MGRKLMIGRYTGDVYVGRGEPGDLDRRIKVATPDDIPGIQSVLAPGVDHAARIEQGDVCLWTEFMGEPAGCNWINFVNHDDKYLGKASRPDADSVYMNQTYVHPDHRIRGIAPRLVIASTVYAANHGRSRTVGIVMRENTPMHNLLQAIGWEVESVIHGVRLGRKMTLRRVVST